MNQHRKCYTYLPFLRRRLYKKSCILRRPERPKVGEIILFSFDTKNFVAFTKNLKSTLVHNLTINIIFTAYLVTILKDLLQAYYKVKIIFVVMISFFMSRRASKASDNLEMTVMKNFYV